MESSRFPQIPEERMRELLEPPRMGGEGAGPPVHMVLDTDTANEVDDQFALVYAMLSPTLRVEGIYAAPFYGAQNYSSGPGDGMERSYDEILRLLDYLGRAPEGLVHRGSDRWLGSLEDPVRSDAAEDLIARARAPREGPLYVATIGAPTNVASALLMAPDIVDKIVVVWMGGQLPQLYPVSNDLNLRQDFPASQLLFSSGVPLVQFPCRNVTELLKISLPELAIYVQGKARIGDYLYGLFECFLPNHYCRTWGLWDIACIAYLINPRWQDSGVIPAPRLLDDMTFDPSPEGGHLMRQGYHLNRDAIFCDFFTKLELFAKMAERVG